MCKPIEYMPNCDHLYGKWLFTWLSLVMSHRRRKVLNIVGGGVRILVGGGGGDRGGANFSLVVN